MENPTDLRLGLMVRIFAVLSLAVVITLAIAPVKGVFTEWRDAQASYNTMAAGMGSDPVDPGIRQIWNPTLGVVDRCVSCHLGMAGGEPLTGRAPFDAHPAIPHDPEKIGCTACHRGQGRATKKEAAHGRVKHWFEPMLPLAHIEAGCGTCHSAIPVGSTGLRERGRLLFLRYDCLACHRLDGRGGGRVAPKVLPDLSGIGMKGVPEGWHEDHMERRAADPDGLIAESYGPISEGDQAAIGEYLATLSGMPRLFEGKRLFHELGCRGCHQVNGVGGTEGADLTGIGARHLKKFVFPAGFRGDRTAFSWQVEHLLAPAEVVADSRMPDQNLTREQAEKITLYLLSLRARELPAAFSPPDRLRADRLGEREFGTDGESLNLVFCAACHGEKGDGRPYGELGESYPAIASADVLAVASDEFLKVTIETGRPGRRMAAWSGSEGGLRPEEIRRLVAWLRSREPTPPDYDAVRTAPADTALGRETYARDCAVCHGAKGEGGIGPSHHSPAFGSLAGDEFVYETITGGRPGTAMARFREYDAKTLASLVAHVQSFSAAKAEKAAPIAFGNAERGREVYGAACATCHGAEGEGGVGPGIGKAGFWRVADSAFLVESHRRGRCRSADGERPAAVRRSALADVAAWLEPRSGRPSVALAGRKVAGDPARGKRLYERSCAGCHGDDGEGKEAPAIANAAFLLAANDGYLQASILRGRRGTAMPAFGESDPGHRQLSAGEVDDIVSYVRSFADRKEGE
jgi:mono/diheme cytochrome c family protein